MRITKNSFFLVILFFFVQLQLFAQADSSKKIYEFVDIPASFKGNYSRYLAQNIRYPIEALENDISGTVKLKVLIGKTGKVEDVEIMEDPGGGLGEEAARVIWQMPDWEPASQNGKTVNYQLTLPVKFMIGDSGKSKKKKRK